MKKADFIQTLTILTLVSLGYFSTDIYLPSLPALETYFGTSEVASQMTLFTYLISFSLTPLIFGPLSDRIGRRKVILIGVIISLAATIGCYSSGSIYQLMGFRFLQGFGTGAVLIATRAMLADLFTGKDLARQINYITMILPLVLSFAPIIGGYLQEGFGWRSVFLFLVCYNILVLLKGCFLNESVKMKSELSLKNVLEKYLELFRHKSFLLFGMGLFLPTIGMFSYLTASPFIFQDVIGLSPSEYGRLAFFIGLVIMFTSFLNSKLLHYYSINTLIRLGSILMICAGILLLTFHMVGILNTWSYLIPTLIYFSCMPFSNSNSVSKAMSQIDHHFGSANALLSTFQFLAGAMASLIFSLIPQVNAFPLAICYLATGVLAFISLHIAHEYEH